MSLGHDEFGPLQRRVPMSLGRALFCKASMQIDCRKAKSGLVVATGLALLSAFISHYGIQGLYNAVDENWRLQSGAATPLWVGCDLQEASQCRPRHWPMPVVILDGARGVTLPYQSTYSDDSEDHAVLFSAVPSASVKCMRPS